MADPTGAIQDILRQSRANTDDLQKNAVFPAIAKLEDSASKLKPDVPMGEFKPVPKPKEEPGIPEDPMKLFANAGSALGILLSFKARRPLVASMNALTAAGEAINKSDYENYQKQMEVWKESNKLALEQANNQNTIWNNVLAVNEKDFTSRKTILDAYLKSGELDTEQYKMGLTGNTAILASQDRRAATAASLSVANMRHMDQERDKNFSLAQKSALAQDLVSTDAWNKLNDKDPYAARAQLMGANGDKAGELGMPFYQTMQVDMTADGKKLARSTAIALAVKGGIPTNVSKDVSAKIDLVQSANELAELTAKRPELATAFGNIIAKVQPLLAQAQQQNPGLSVTALAEMENNASAAAVEEYLKQHPQSEDFTTDLRGFQKKAGLIAFKQAASFGRLTIYSEQTMKELLNPSMGPNAYMRVLYDVSTDAGKNLERLGFASQYMTPKAKASKYALMALGPANLFQAHKDISEKFKDGSLEKAHPGITYEEAMVDWITQHGK